MHFTRGKWNLSHLAIKAEILPHPSPASISTKSLVGLGFLYSQWRKDGTSRRENLAEVWRAEVCLAKLCIKNSKPNHLSMRSQCSVWWLRCIKKGLSSRNREVVLSLGWTLLKSLKEYLQSWHPQFRKDTDILEFKLNPQKLQEKTSLAMRWV